MGPTQAQSTLIRFGVFEANLQGGELRRNGAKVRLQELPFRVLALLLSRPGEVISRDEFRQALWPPDVFVDFDRGISSAVKRLRDALGDSPDNPIFIETIEKRGYRWIGPMHVAAETVAAVQIPVPVSAPAPSRSLGLRSLAFALPLVVLGFAIWLWYSGSRHASAKSAAMTAVGGTHKPANPEAEEFYLKGRYFWNKRTPESLNQAVDAFTQAIVHDPSYSEAYVGLADCYNLLREFSAMPEAEAYSRAYAAAQKAVELDDQSSEAHASLAFAMFFGRAERANGVKEFRRAIALNPANAQAHHWFATALMGLTRYDDALAEIEQARKLDPNSSSILADKGEILLLAGHTDEAVQLLTQLETSEPGFVSPHRYLKYHYFNTGNYPNYLAEFKQEAVAAHDEAMQAMEKAVAAGYTKSGKRGLLEALLAEQLRLYERGKSLAYQVAESEALVGNKAEALRYLDAAMKSHDGLLMYLNVDPAFAGLRDDPVFQQMAAKAEQTAR